MPVKISLFPKLDEVQRSLLFAENPLLIDNYNFSYSFNNENRRLDLEEIEPGVFALFDKKNEWHPEKNNLKLSLNFVLSNCSLLFGKNGIACGNAILGLALIWYSSSSRQRSVKEIGEVRKVEKTVSYSTELTFSEAQLRGIVGFQVELFIKKTGKPAPKESHLANIVGTKIGTIHEFSIMLDSKGSELPLYDVYEPDNKLLWYMRKYWDDPTSDSFLDSFSIFVNKAHKDFALLKNSESNEISSLAIEMMSSVYSTLIYEMQQDQSWDCKVKKGKDLETGSAAAAIHYFIDTVKTNLDSPLTISESIRKYLSAGK